MATLSPATSQDSPPEASLLGMPAEIRNRIYHEVLVQGDVDLTLYYYDDNDSEDPESNPASTFLEPGLLRCCRQIRQEARAIFLKNNQFHTTVLREAIVPQVGHWFWHGLKKRNRHVEISGEFAYYTLFVWLEAYWSGKLSEALFCEIFDCRKDEDYPQLKILMEAFNIVDGLKTFRWERVKFVLDSFYKAVWFTGDFGGHTLSD